MQFIFLLSFDGFHFPSTEKDWRQKAETELGENDEHRKEKVKQLYEIIINDENIPLARRDDSFLLRFLRAKKFDVDKAFRMVNITHYMRDGLL